MQIGNALLGVLISALGGLLLWYISSFPELPDHYFGPGLFPSLVAGGLVLSGALLLLRSVREVKLAQAWGRFVGPRYHRHGWLGAAILLAAILTFVTLGETLGFPLLIWATLLVFYVWAGRRVLEILTLPLLLTVAFHLLFSKLLRVPLPVGMLGDYLW